MIRTSVYPQKMLLALCSLCLLAIIHNQLAWVFLAMSYLMLWQTNRHENIHVLTFMGLILTAHHLMGYIQTHGINIPLPINDLDSKSYHTNTIIYNDYSAAFPYLLTEIYHSHIIFFRALLAYLYQLTPAWFLGAEAMIVCFTWALISLNRILTILAIGQKERLIALAFFGLLPHSLIWTSITMRESLEMALIIGLIATIIDNLQSPWAWRQCWIAWLGYGLMMAFLQPVTLVIAAVLLPLAFIIRLPCEASTKKKLMIGLIAIAMLVTTIPIAGHPAFIALLKAKIIAFRDNSLAFVGNTNYLPKHQFYPSPSTWITFIWHSVSLYGHYLFGPYPWELSKHLGQPYKLIILMSYQWMKAFMMGCIIYQYRVEPCQSKTIYQLLGFCYCFITAMFALGTFNYMQGLRHHLLTDWMLFVLFARAISEWKAWDRLKFWPYRTPIQNKAH
jgi:hypothetical protein